LLAASEARDCASDATEVAQDWMFEAAEPPSEVMEEMAAAPPVSKAEAMEVASSRTLEATFWPSAAMLLAAETREPIALLLSWA
jgi:hypothetical protein